MKSRLDVSGRARRHRTGGYLAGPRSLAWFCLFEVTILCGCGDDVTNSPPAGPPELIADSVAVLEINGYRVPVVRSGELFEVQLEDGTGLLFLAGLWIGGRIHGDPHAGVMWVGRWPFSCFTSRWDSEQIGPYLVTPDHLTHPDLDWPVEHGAPVDLGGEPRIYGDAMVWSSLQADSLVAAENILYGKPVPGLRIGQSVFGYEQDGLRNLLFVRYDLENLGGETLEDAYLGFYSDTDLVWNSSGPSTNATAYDSTRGISYTYLPDLPATAPQVVCGFAFMSVPGANLPGVYAHRPMRKNSAVDPDYGEIGVDLPLQLLYALTGRSNSGATMIDPSTGLPTRLAFTGNPETGEGWIDVPSEVRSLLSTGPLTFRPGQKLVFTVAFIHAFGENRTAAIADLQATVDLAREHPDLFE